MISEASGSNPLRFSQHSAKLREHVRNAGVGRIEKSHLVAAIVVIVVAGLVIASCVPMELPASILKAFKDVPMGASLLVAITGVGLTILGYHDKKSDSASKSTDIVEIYTHSMADRMLSSDQTQSYKIARVVGPLFIGIALFSLISLNVSQLAMLGLPIKILLATTTAVIAIRSLWLYYHTSPQVIDNMVAETEKEQVKYLLKMILKDICVQLDEVYNEVKNDLYNRFHLDILFQEKYDEKLRLLEQSKGNLKDSLITQLEGMKGIETVDELFRQFHIETREAASLERSTIAEAQAWEIKLDPANFRKRVKKFHNDDAVQFKAEKTLNNSEETLKQLSSGAIEWMRGYLNHLNNLYNILPEKPDGSDQSLTTLRNKLVLLSICFSEAKELEKLCEPETLADEQEFYYRAIIRLLWDVRSDLLEQLKKDHIQAILSG